MLIEATRCFITEAQWFLTTSNELKERGRQITTDLKLLYQKGLIPQSPHSILDAGSGSGAGSVALRKLFPEAKIQAIDDGSSHQNHPVYRRRLLPAFVANFQPMSIESFAMPNAAHFDLILACRLPVCHDQSPTWKETCTRGADRLIALARMLSLNGVLAFGYSPREYPKGTVVLAENLLLNALFAGIRTGDLNDNWLILSEVNQESLKTLINNPPLLLSEKGQRTDYPYRFQGGIAPDLWDY